ncbi:hypothetical protein ACOMHN_021653 [Nucella lapillus]
MTTSSAESDVGDDQLNASLSAPHTTRQDKNAKEAADTNNDSQGTSGVYLGPLKNGYRGAKRAAQPKNWKINVRKRRRLEGKAYINYKGHTVPAKTLQDIDCNKCLLKCSGKISNEERRVIFLAFHELANYQKQKDFVCRHVEERKTRTYLGIDGNPVGKVRNVARRFFLMVGGEKIKVCKRFFQATLAVGETYIDHALKNSAGGAFSGDKRGKMEPSNKTPKAERQRAKKHIESFPAMEAHYWRKNTSIRYLEGALNVSRMHNLYLSQRHNRSQFITAALHQAVLSIPNIQTIDLKFLESGHPEADCDTVSACIERAKKGVTIHHPDQWLTVCQCARLSYPFKVIPLTYDVVYDFKHVARTTMKNAESDVHNPSVNWLRMKWIRVSKRDADTVYFKYKMTGPFQKLKIRSSNPGATGALPALYSSQLQISEAKLEDLADMCLSGIIPRHHHEFFCNLPSSPAVKDCLACADVTEELDDTDDE